MVCLVNSSVKEANRLEMFTFHDDGVDCLIDSRMCRDQETDKRQRVGENAHFRLSLAGENASLVKMKQKSHGEIAS